MIVYVTIALANSVALAALAFAQHRKMVELEKRTIFLARELTTAYTLITRLGDLQPNQNSLKVGEK